MRFRLSVWQTILKFSGGRKLVHPPPEWREVLSEHHPNLVITEWTDLPAAYLSKLNEMNQNGGGWINQGPKLGTYAVSGGYTEWSLRCASRAAYGCMAMAKLRFFYVTKSLVLLVSAGREHKHTGQCMLTRGLPPDLKCKVDAILDKHPNIRLRYTHQPTRVVERLTLVRSSLCCF